MCITKTNFIALNDMDIHIYKSPGCGYCVKIIELMNRAGVKYRTTTIGKDMTLEEFKNLHPDVHGFPFAIIDDVPIGGLVETVKFFVDKGLVSSKKNG